MKYLSIGYCPARLPITYNNLKTLELYEVSFEDMKEILVVLRLIANSPNLKELQISVSYCTYSLMYAFSMLVIVLMKGFDLVVPA